MLFDAKLMEKAETLLKKYAAKGICGLPPQNLARAV